MRHLPLLAAVAFVPLSLPAQDWRPSYPANMPMPRIGARMVYDAARSEVVLFGGQVSPPASNDTWTWNGTTWTQRFPAQSPIGRVYHAMAYDSTRQRVVLYGGQSGPSPLNDTWEWDGTNWTPTTPATSPPLRYFPVMVYNGTRTLLFGGNSPGGALNDTWTWTGTNWAQITTANAPSPRYYQSMASNGAGQVVLFGGFAPSLGYLADTWTFSGNNWTPAAPTASPSVRGVAGMAWDPANARYLLFSGTDSFFSNLEDTWSFAGGQWSQLATQRSPSGRKCGGSAVWFPPQNRFLVYSAEYAINFDQKNSPMWEFGQGLASFIRFGNSVCPAIDPPVLRGHLGQPALGTTFEARVESVGQVLTMLALGLSDTTWSGGALPFDLAAVGTNPGCLVRVSPDILLYLGNAFSAPGLLTVPNDPALAGFTMYAQGFTWGLGTFPTNLSLANAATLRVDTN